MQIMDIDICCTQKVELKQPAERPQNESEKKLYFMFVFGFPLLFLTSGRTKTATATQYKRPPSP